MEKYIFKNLDRILNEINEMSISPGLSAVVAFNNNVIYSKSLGYSDTKKTKAINNDDLFRVFSLSKLATILGFMRLYEKGLFELDDHVEKYIPEFSKIKIGKSKLFFIAKKLKRPLTIRHLLTMTSGIVYGQGHGLPNILAMPIHLSWNSKHFHRKNKTCLDLAKKISKIPLLFEPGSQFNYGMNFEVISGIIEVISKKDFVDFMQEEVFDKLGMIDTTYWYKDRNRGVDLQFNFLRNKKNNFLKKINKKVRSKFSFIGEIKKRKCVQAGGSLVSSSLDYIKLLNTCITGRDKNNELYIGNDTLTLIKMPQSFFNDGFMEAMTGLNQFDYAYSFCGRIRRKNTTKPFTNIGEFGWNGVGGCFSLVDEKCKITAVNFLSGFPAINKITDVMFIEALYLDLKENNII